MSGRFVVTDAWVASLISSKLRAIVRDYKPTGYEREFSLRSLHTSIDPLWHPYLEAKNEDGVNWIAFPSRIPILSDLKNEEGQTIPLRLYFGKTPKQPIRLSFQINSEIIPIKYVEQGLLLLHNLRPAVDEVKWMIEKELKKEEKIRALVESSAESSIRSLLSGKGLSYHVDFLPQTFVLLILLPYNRVVQFTISYDKYADFVEILPKQLEHIRQSIQGFPYSIKTADYRVNWTRLD